VQGSNPCVLQDTGASALCQDLDMERVDLDTSIGYALKRTATALRVAMEASLRSLGLSVPQYSCLEILNARPGISNADLARGAPGRLPGGRARERRRPGARPALLVDARG
jgi:hypothetical protein